MTQGQLNFLIHTADQKEKKDLLLMPKNFVKPQQLIYPFIYVLLEDTPGRMQSIS